MVFADVKEGVNNISNDGNFLPEKGNLKISVPIFQ